MKKDFGRAIDDIHELLKREPRHFGALSGLGIILQEVGDEKDTLAAFRRALAIHPHLERIPDLVKKLTDKIDGRDILIGNHSRPPSVPYEGDPQRPHALRPRKRGEAPSRHWLEQQPVGIQDGHLNDAVLLHAALAEFVEELAQGLADGRREYLPDVA